MKTTPSTPAALQDLKNWRQIVARYQSSSRTRSIWQLVNTLVPYFILWYLAYLSLDVSYLLTLAVSVVAGGFLVRTFIIFHDCGHGSFFSSQNANDIVGLFTGILTFTPYYQWRHSHAIHHASAGDLDRRGVGDVWTATVDEFMAMSRLKRLWYRIYRNPILMFGFGPAVEFLLANRFVTDSDRKRERYSVHITNLALLGIIIAMSQLIGLKAYLLVQLPIILIAGSAGVWLFYVQHQFEDVYWERHDKWDYAMAALKGSSFYKLPKILQWFSGNIGFHHIHHLSPRIPNYKLEQCYKENSLFQQVKPLTLLTSLKSATFRLWDEQNRQLVGYEFLRTYKPQRQGE